MGIVIALLILYAGFSITNKVSEIIEEIKSKIRKEYSQYNYIITIDSDFISKI
ncbi:hypothetical protein ACQPUY_07215 [Clostridium nigeriense]|uniref:hypothetical protein n=1 Tax=Clostridium nigeriense TaxID=1805470 RepID=UPI003D330902